MVESPIQRIRQLDQERAQLLASAKKEALDRASQAISDLNALGFNYRITETGQMAAPATRKGTRRVKDAPCPVCKFRTRPPHDARKHRAQGKRKRPFTADELKAMGIEKV